VLALLELGGGCRPHASDPLPAGRCNYAAFCAVLAGWMTVNGAHAICCGPCVMLPLLFIETPYQQENSEPPPPVSSIRALLSFGRSFGTAGLSFFGPLDVVTLALLARLQRVSERVAEIWPQRRRASRRAAGAEGGSGGSPGCGGSRRAGQEGAPEELT
jgi:hypothetical protein